MRYLFKLLVIALIGYFGWQYYQKNPDVIARYLPNKNAPDASETPSDEPVSDAVVKKTDETATPPAPKPATPTPRPIPRFISKIVVPKTAEGERPMAAPGQLLVLERTSVETRDGIIAVVPGDTVKLVERRGDGTVKVTDGTQDFVLKDSQVTRDIEVAQEAERKEYEKKYHPR